MTPEKLAEFQKSIAAALAAIPGAAQLAGTNTVDAIINAYNTGDWSNVTSLSGVPFTKEQQRAAVAEAERALAPAYKAQEAYDTSIARDALEAEQKDFGAFTDAEAKAFGVNKDVLDQNAADQGVLFSGSRVQKLNDLRSTYAEREAARRGIAESNIRSTARDYQYKYGDDGAKNLRDYYKLPGASTFDPNVAGGKVTPGGGLTSLYNTGDFKFQGTAPVAQKAAVQTRAASLLGNRANKLSTLGYKTQF